jgi:hypothetical protein
MADGQNEGAAGGMANGKRRSGRVRKPNRQKGGDDDENESDYVPSGDDEQNSETESSSESLEDSDDSRAGGRRGKFAATKKRPVGRPPRSALHTHDHSQSMNATYYGQEAYENARIPVTVAQVRKRALASCVKYPRQPLDFVALQMLCARFASWIHW